MNPQETGSRGGHRPFGLRGWQFHVNHDRSYLAQAAERSIREAPGFDVTHLEFSNMAMQLPYAYTWEWLADRYGIDAGPLLARVFERTPQIVHGIFAPLWCGYWHPFSVMEHTTLPWPPTRLQDHGSVPWDPPPDILEVTGGLGDNDFSRVVSWMGPGTAVETIGWCQLVSRKEEGLRLARLCSEEVAVEGRTVLSHDDYGDLDLLFRQLVAVCRADVLTGKILAASRGPRKDATILADLCLSSLSIEAEQMAGEIRRDFGADFFGELALRVEAWGRWAKEGASTKDE